ncbi:MAG: Do family serine endopeptidase [Bacteroidota bacterium]
MKSTIKNFLATILIASIGGFAGVTVYKATEKNEISDAKSITEKQNVRFANYKPDMSPTAFNFMDAAEKTVPAVVYVKTTYPVRNTGLYSNPFQGFFFGAPQNQPAQQSAGSGVIISDDGYIVTNNHVVDEAAKVEVTLDDKRTFTAKVIGTDPSTDLALLKIDQKNLSFIPYGNSDDVKVGEWVLAVGNPFNLTSTVTAGIVSAKGRNIHILDNQNFPLESFIQTDAAVNPGNSGGALVSTTGDLVGINSAIASSTGAYAGYSFAIPVNIVKKVMDDLLEYGNVQRGFIGISIRDIDQKLADDKNIKVLKGVYVQNLTEGGAAETAGIKSGDVITKVGGVSVGSSSELQEQVGRFRPGDKIEVTLLHDGTEKTVSVVLRNNQGGTKLVKNDEDVNLLGAEFSPPSENEIDKLGINSGVKISKLGPGKLRMAGIKEGFIITKIDNQKITSTDELQAALQSKKGGVLIEGIYPNGLRAYYGFGM